VLLLAQKQAADLVGAEKEAESRVLVLQKNAIERVGLGVSRDGDVSTEQSARENWIKEQVITAEVGYLNRTGAPLRWTAPPPHNRNAKTLAIRTGRAYFCEGMESDFMARGYLLPPGCKDLIDVLNIKQQAGRAFVDISNLKFSKLKPPVWKLKPPEPSKLLPPIVGEIVVPEKTSVSQLAALVGQKPFQILADLMEIGVFASVNQALGFGTIARIARKYGFTARKAP
jgi:hypothetical protein